MADTDPYLGLRDHARYLSRLVRGRIVDVSEDVGKVQVDTIDFMGTRTVTVPPLWFSAAGRKSAWGRYMPLSGELVDIGFRNDGTAAIVSYNANCTKDGTPGWFGTSDMEGFSTFKALKKGEFDFKSSGDAYIFGSAFGTLLLAGGQATIKLDKQAYRIESKASEFHYTSGVSEIRFGTIFRKTNLTDNVESPQSSGTIPYLEFQVDINESTTAGIKSPQSKAKIQFGDILNSTNTPVTSDNGQKVRGLISIGDSLNASEVFKLEIDAGGNLLWEQKGTTPPVAKIKVDNTTIDITGSAGQLYLKLAGAAEVAVAIADHLQTLYDQLKTKLDAHDPHTHMTAFGPSSPPSVQIMAPSWDSKINSTKLNIPDG